MKFPRIPALALCLYAFTSSLWAQNTAAENEAGPPEDNYVPGPDSKPQPGVPTGATFDFVMESTTIFPGTKRTITVYVPAQYTGEQPACVFVSLDSLGWRAPVVFDNLIHKKQMPVTIGIGVAPGKVDSAAPENPRNNRSYEFDSLSDQLARFIVEEVFPAVEQKKTPDGRSIKLSANPNDRAIGGGSTGAIAAFTVAWQRPDQFRRVFSSIGTFVGMRGGDHYPVLVRKTEPKPLRIYMQDGSNDQWRNGYQMGDWWTANQTMEKALKWAGYDVEHNWGTGFHTSKHAKAIFPEVMRWLWRDWPAPIATPNPVHPILQEILLPNESWKLVAKETTGRLVADEKGNVTASQNTSALRHDGSRYTVDGGKLWFHPADGKARIVDGQPPTEVVVAITPDERWLFVGGSGERVGYSYQVQADGGLQYKEPYYLFEVPAAASGSGLQQACFDRNGLLYTATADGVQVFDRNGRVTAILPSPDAKPVTGIVFGGSNFSTLSITTASGRYERKMKAQGIAPGAQPIVLSTSGQG